MMLIEPFAGYEWHPSLRGWKHRNTMTVAWDECGLVEYTYCIEFKFALDSDAMNAALLAIWDHYKPQCDRRASFCYGGMNGCMDRVPLAAGLEVMAVVREFLTKALEQISDASSWRGSIEHA